MLQARGNAGMLDKILKVYEDEGVEGLLDSYRIELGLANGVFDEVCIVEDESNKICITIPHPLEGVEPTVTVYENGRTRNLKPVSKKLLEIANSIIEYAMDTRLTCTP